MANVAKCLKCIECLTSVIPHAVLSSYLFFCFQHANHDVPSLDMFQLYKCIGVSDGGMSG